jgi:hypothetical protein
MNAYQRDIFRFLSIEHSALILDWGCGEGIEIDSLKRQGFLNVEGLDINPEFIRADITIDSDSIGFLERNIGRWDVIFARQSIYYIPKDMQKRLWKAFYAALKPEGQLIVIVFNGAITTSEWILQKDHGINFVLNEISLRTLGCSAGFTKNDVIGIKNEHRTPFGFLASILLNTYKISTNKLRYLSERGFDKQNPKLFTKSIALLAGK